MASLRGYGRIVQLMIHPIPRRPFRQLLANTQTEQQPDLIVTRTVGYAQPLHGTLRVIKPVRQSVAGSRKRVLPVLG